MIAGIAWIGASFYFNWLEGALDRSHREQEPGLAGDLWAVHGGGFYHVLKLKEAPQPLPQVLHWFKFEAYLTWVSGFSLLSIIYYLRGDAFLLDPDAGISLATGVGISLATLIGSWLVYHNLRRVPFLRNSVLLLVLMMLLLLTTGWALDQVFTARAAYIHVGAMIGTIMAANVFFVIIPSQKLLVGAALQGGAPPDGKLAKEAGLRSLHNNYFTLPLLFIMISNHYPMTFGSPYPWLMLLLLAVVGIMVRHWFNLKNKKRANQWLLPVAFLLFLGLGWVNAQLMAPSKTTDMSVDADGAVLVNDMEVAAIVHARCQPCHSRAPTDDIFTVAPLGVSFDSLQEVRKIAHKVKQRSVQSQTMPLANKTKMTDEERKKLGRWLDQQSTL